MAPSKADIDRWFSLQKPTPEEGCKLDAIRDVFRETAHRVVALTPPGPDQTAAVRKLRESMQTFIASIVCVPRA